MSTSKWLEFQIRSLPTIRPEKYFMKSDEIYKWLDSRFSILEFASWSVGGSKREDRALYDGGQKWKRKLPDLPSINPKRGIDVVSLLTTRSSLSSTLFYSLFSFFPSPTITDKCISTLYRQYSIQFVLWHGFRHPYRCPAISIDVRRFWLVLRTLHNA